MDEEAVDEQEQQEDEENGENIDDVVYFHPLTGMEADEEFHQRAISVIINNHPSARPQSGLSKADIVYELLAEGNITRLLAIFQSEKPETIGPIRSARDYFIDLAEGYSSLFIAHGYSPDAKAILQSGRIDHLNGIRYDGSLFERASFRKAPHNSYISYANIEKGAQDEGYLLNESPLSLSFYNQDDIDQLSGDPIHTINIAYGNQFDNEYHYDAQASTYQRSTSGEATIEYDTAVPVQTDNVFVVEAHHQVIDSEGRRQIDLTSGGRAYLFHKGIMKELEWKNVDGRLLPFENGQPAKLVPGKTWISIVPNMDYVTYSQ